MTLLKLVVSSVRGIALEAAAQVSMWRYCPDRYLGCPMDRERAASDLASTSRTRFARGRGRVAVTHALASFQGPRDS
jgi:hypothetical protein